MCVCVCVSVCVCLCICVFVCVCVCGILKLPPDSSEVFFKKRTNLML